MRSFLEQYDVLFLMTAVGMVTILLKCISAWMYQRLIQDAGKMATTENRWIRSMVVKFEAYYKLKLPVKNVEYFVERYLYEYHFLGVTMMTWENMGVYGFVTVGMMYIFSMLLGMYYQIAVSQQLIYGTVTLLLLSMIGSAEFFLQIHRKDRILRIHLLEYMENTLRSRMENEYLHPREREAYQREYFEEPVKTEQEKKFEEIARMDGAERMERLVELEREHHQGQDDVRMDAGFQEEMQELLDLLLNKNEQNSEEKTGGEEGKQEVASSEDKMQLVEEIINEYL